MEDIWLVWLCEWVGGECWWQSAMRGVMEIMGGGVMGRRGSKDRQADKPIAWRCSPHPLLALCHAPSSPPELSLACQNQSQDAMLSASHVPVWTGWHQISGAMCQGPYENRCPHYWVARALKIQHTHLSQKDHKLWSFSLMSYLFPFASKLCWMAWKYQGIISG